MTLRFCLFVDDLSGGGAERKVLILADQLVRLGHDAQVVTLTDRVAYPIPAGVATRAVYPGGARNLDQFWRVGRSARDLGRIVHELEGRGGPFDLFLSNLDATNKIVSRLAVAPVYFVMRNSVEEELRRARRLGPLQYLRMRSAKMAVGGRDLITVSHGLEREIVERGRLRPRSIRTILNPYDLDEIRRLSLEPVAEIPREPFLLHVGRFARQKRHDLLFRALERVDPAYKLVLLAHRREKALRCAARYGVADRVIAPGFRANPYPWMRRARLTVLSSDFEGFVNVLVESLACGTPAVSTRCPHGPDEILTGPLAHWLVPRRNPRALADKINEALATRIDVGGAEILDRVRADRIAAEYVELAVRGAGDRHSRAPAGETA
ncbi:MAG TPA: glycosyltransferase [Candidatus Polarisedimenticolaceae bacterium]|nr:glycosyltransferase [Candidatus Polarisedimenticolaceae bacterium]